MKKELFDELVESTRQAGIMYRQKAVRKNGKKGETPKAIMEFMNQPTTAAYKLFRVRKDGTLGPLFIDRKLVYKDWVWMVAESVPTKGFALRPGFHATHAPSAPHLKTEGREWRMVLLKGVTEHMRPEAQGGLWYTAKYMLVMPKGAM